MQVTGDLSSYANLSSSASQDRAATKVQAPVLPRDSDGDTDKSKSPTVTASNGVKTKIDVYA